MRCRGVIVPSSEFCVRRFKVSSCLPLREHQRVENMARNAKRKISNSEGIVNENW